MPTQIDQEWDSVIAQLSSFGTLEDGWDGHDGEAPGQLLVQNAISLAETFRSWGALPAHRVSSTRPGLIRFEWLTLAAHVVIALNKSSEAEVISYSNRGSLSSEVSQ